MVLTIEAMTRISYIMMGMAVMFMIISFVVFWKFDIQKTWFILYGSKSKRINKHNARYVSKVTSQMPQMPKPELDQVESIDFIEANQKSNEKEVNLDVKNNETDEQETIPMNDLYKHIISYLQSKTASPCSTCTKKEGE